MKRPRRASAPGPRTRREAAEPASACSPATGTAAPAPGDTAGGGRPSGADPLPVLPAGTDRQPGI